MRFFFEETKVEYSSIIEFKHVPQMIPVLDVWRYLLSFWTDAGDSKSFSAYRLERW